CVSPKLRRASLAGRRFEASQGSGSRAVGRSPCFASLRLRGAQAHGWTQPRRAIVEARRRKGLSRRGKPLEEDLTSLSGDSATVRDRRSGRSRRRRRGIWGAAAQARRGGATTKSLPPLALDREDIQDWTLPGPRQTGGSRLRGPPGGRGGRRRSQAGGRGARGSGGTSTCS
ncbi:hypothetical protein T484DRAFT_1921101, partial [Baffinella frigidus]